jgi:hypothetical protein
MTWRGGIVCALAGLLAGATGCWTGGDGMAFLRFDMADKGRTYTAHGSVSDVSFKAQTALQQAGLYLTVKRDGDNVMLKSTTASGRHFTLTLNGTKTAAGEQTQIRIDWDGEPDNVFWADFLSRLYSIQTGATLERPPGATQ